MSQLEHDWEWLGAPLAVDFVNTVKRQGMETVELWCEGSDVEHWSRRQDGRVALLAASDAAEHLDELLALRSDVTALLRSAARGEGLPAGATERVNARARREPIVVQLGPHPGRWYTRVEPSDPVGGLAALVVASAIEMVGTAHSSAVGFCDAPSCGQFFIQDRRNQRWCGPACGTRARVARHARRSGRGGGPLRSASS